MKRIITAAIAVLGLSLSLAAQSSQTDFKARYETQVRRVGIDGLGVETLLERWEKAYPEDIDMLVGKFNYYLAKSMTTEMVVKDKDRFLGARPALSLKDSLGRDVNYFEETMYDDSLFAISSQAIDKAVKVSPDRLDLRFAKITALLGYEKESPDMSTMALSGLIDYDGTVHPSWKYGEEAADKILFESGIQEYCASLYSIGSPASFESFRTLSERMLKYSPNNTLFLTNLGTYHFVARKDNKTAMKYYSKVLKLEPDNYTAIKNSVLMARRDKNVKQERKYLPLLVKYGADETERMSAQARLDALNSKK